MFHIKNYLRISLNKQNNNKLFIISYMSSNTRQLLFELFFYITYKLLLSDNVVTLLYAK